ncbi:MAG: enoyl-CoA hydratase/isomerase family protein [Myxococcota bacterium]|nr:enoyl-CoA hydratase/isomerase family protein [Myxococcota bacterium]
MSDTVGLEVLDHIAVITLNRPERRNAIDAEMVEAFHAVVQQVRGRSDVRVVVVTGAGRSFCSGADFSALPSLAQESGHTGILASHAAIESLYRGFLGLGELEVPTIAAINGACVGGGLGIALLCDMRVVAARAKIGANFSRLGIHPGMGITGRLPSVIGYQAAAKMLFTGELIRGDRAVEVGLALEAVDFDEVLPRAMELAAQIAESAPLAVRCIKRTLRTTAGRDVDDILALEAMAQALLSQSEDAAEGVAASMQSRTPRFRGS